MFLFEVAFLKYSIWKASNHFQLCANLFSLACFNIVTSV